MPVEAIKTPLIDALTHYDGLGRQRFHVPGHSGADFIKTWGGDAFAPLLSNDLLRFDQTEVEGLDVLSEPSECLLEAQQAAAESFGVAQSFFLVNGATAGILALMLAAFAPGDKILLPRNVHRSVISGLILAGLEPVWFLPPWLSPWGLWGGITPKQVTPLLDQHPDIRGLIITSPTYEGIGSEVSGLGTLCRERGLLLLVDEAHGSLWPFSPELPPSAVTAPCDGVVHSLHKTGGSLTQSALVHLPHGSKISVDSLQQGLNTIQTTSPSYLLMASLDGARAFLSSPPGQERLQNLLQNVSQLRNRLSQLKPVFELFSPTQHPHPIPHWDPTKLYLRHQSLPGQDWAVRLEAEQQVAYESTSPFGTLYLAGLGLKPTDYETFFQVFAKEASRTSTSTKSPLLEAHWPTLPLPNSILLPREAFFTKGIHLPAPQSVGKIAKETLVHCPPGIPVLIPGEQIQPEHMPYLPQQVWVVA